MASEQALIGSLSRIANQLALNGQFHDAQTIRSVIEQLTAGLEVRPKTEPVKTLDAATANMLAELRARRMDTRVVDLIERLSARVAALEE